MRRQGDSGLNVGRGCQTIRFCLNIEFYYFDSAGWAVEEDCLAELKWRTV
jgi:hypothetical protein